jgi:Protein of unknown function (DUF1553)
VNTNTPIAAFALLNDPVFIEAAQALARRTIDLGDPSSEARATYAFRRVLARPPSNDEVHRLVQLFDSERKHYEQDRDAATELATNDTAPTHTADVAELAAWTVVGNVLLNLDETLTK